MKTVESLYRARIPTLLWGPPGVGKTAFVEALARREGAELVLPTVRSPEDVAVPVPRERGVIVEPVAEFARVVELSQQGRPVIVFVDEITTLDGSVQASVLRFLDSGVLAGHRIPPTVWRVAAGNPPELAAGGWELSAPTANRVAHVEYVLDAQEWVREFPSYWGAPPTIPTLDAEVWGRSRALVAGFIRTQPHLLLQVPREASRRGRAWPSPRTWDMASRALAACGLDVRSAADAVVACVGDGAGLQFVAWAREIDVPTPEEVLRDPAALDRVQRPDALWAVLGAVQAHLAARELDEATWAAAWAVALRAAERARDIVAGALVSWLCRQYVGSAGKLRLRREWIAPFAALLREAGVIQ